jgi:predicted ATP-binding protein involved in virulence
MKLTRLDITNFRCFESLAIPLQPDVNVFVGVNGSGKTTLLDAIAIALYDIVAANGGGGKRQRMAQNVTLRPTDIYMPPGSEDAVIDRRDFVQVSAVANQFYELPSFSRASLFEEFEQFLSIEWTDYIQYRPPNEFLYDTSKSEKLSSVYNYFDSLWQEIRNSDARALIPLPVVAYYRSNRRLTGMPEMGNIFESRLGREGAFQNALDSGANYKAMMQWFYLRENQELRERLQVRNDRGFELPDLKAVRSALVHCLDNVDQVFFSDNPPSLKFRQNSPSHETRILNLEQLSDGYRNLLALVLDFARRLAQAHPNWDNPLDAPGILLIDEIELHLHPQWQQRVIPNLRTVFPNTQLIVTTHSPQVLTTVESEHIAILKDHQLYAAPVSTYGAESGRVMREVMQTDNRPPDNEITTQLRQLFELINQDRLNEAMNLCEEMMRSLPDEPALIEAQTIIKNREWEKELGL